MNAITTLSTTATKLLAYLQATGGAWENNCMDHVFEKPEYASNPDAQRAYWQWQANAYGCVDNMPVGPDSISFGRTIDRKYSLQLSDAYQELKAAGLADERNSGFNDYFFYPIQ